ncbi:gamma-glutamyltransferase 2. Threonine peptidase. MEROPS family T03 [Agrococcus baldri]|uniref:Gamma-glutamyltransferase 2. Threonine peptidase. MEROPS family T03 n=1 Tax=Agrococcus baldri TaxID=153730 RepID=A0AA94HK02_9MICO|nr:gamma-glutamyltransferase [Agrococcus baldri]SFR98098.1 gamma-glutamyltransferase 2. Threonine peptidase. MEROPS family T03 [Agrococcus baldri]
MMRTRPELTGSFGAVASTHWLASSSGMAVLERGGNAADAAVAAGFVLHVVEPHLNGPGGDMPLIVRVPGGEPRVLSGQGVTPAAATIEQMRAEGIEHIPGTGLLAAVVPGAVPAWLTLLRDHGSWAPAEVLAFAIELADRGHRVLPRVARTIAGRADFFREHWPASAALWADPAPADWDMIRNPALAETYRRLADAGRGKAREAACDAAIAAWSEGFVAEAIDRHSREPQMDSTGEAHAGLLTGDDLAAWRPQWEDTLSLPWRGTTVHKAGAWTQGPALLEALGILDPLLPERAAHEGSDAFGPDLVHVAAEAAKLAFADRDAWFGDGADLSRLLHPDYLAERRALIGEQASLALRPGALHGAPRLAQVRTADEHAAAAAADGGAAAAGTGEPTRGDTCHIDVVDRDGMVVSATPSGGWLQSSPTIAELGFCLGTRAQMLWLEPGLPTSLAPGIRPRTTLSPTMLVDDDGTVAALGTPGGDQQDQWQLSMLLGMRVLGLSPQAAIDAPAWHLTHLVSSFEPRVWEPGGLHVESRLGEATIAELRRRGHVVTDAGPWSLGRLSFASFEAGAAGPGAGGEERRRLPTIRAAANPRGEQGYAALR